MSYVTKMKNTLNPNKKNVMSLKKKNNKISKGKAYVLKLNKDDYEKKLIIYSKSTDLSRNQKKKNEEDIKNPLLLSTSIKRIQTFLPNINNLLNTESNFNYNPSRQEHIKFEENIKKEISFYEKEEKELKEKIEKLEKQLLRIENKIIDSKIEIQALKTISVSNVKSPLRKLIIRKLENDLNKEEKSLVLKYSSPIKSFRSPMKKATKNLPSISNSEFNARLNVKLMEEEKLNKEKEKNIQNNIGIINNNKEIIHIELTDNTRKFSIVHNNRKVLIEQLYNHYLNLLQEGKDSRKEGLAWVIMEIFYLNKRVLLSNFPKYLDNDCIHYLFKIANLSIRIIQLENKLKDKKDKLNIYMKNYKIKNANKNFMNFFYDGIEENVNNYEYNKKQLTSILSTFSKKFNSNLNFSRDNIIGKTKSNKALNLTISENNRSIPKIIRKKFIFKTSKISGKGNLDINNEEKLKEYFYKKRKKKQYKVSDLQKFFDENHLLKENEAFNSDEYQNYFILSNELFSLKQEKEKLKIKEMDRIFKEFQKNNYKQRYQVEKKVVISALIGEDNLENELFKQSKREKDYIYKMNKIKLTQNKNKTFNKGNY